MIFVRGHHVYLKKLGYLFTCISNIQDPVVYMPMYSYGIGPAQKKKARRNELLLISPWEFEFGYMGIQNFIALWAPSLQIQIPHGIFYKDNKILNPQL